MAFRKGNIDDLLLNPFTMISKDWLLLTAGDEVRHNTMTASWGAVGFIWKVPASTVYVRPQRYTLEFMEKHDYYSICFFDESHRKTLAFCGANSGRDCNKDEETGLTPVFDQKAPYYAQARMVLICKKLYKQNLQKDGFVDENMIDQFYPENDLHEMFIGEITEVLINEN